MISHVVSVPAARLTLPGDLVLPESARAVVLFAHGIQTSRHNPAIRLVAAELHQAGLGTLALDLFSETEAHRAEAVRGQRVDMEMLGRRLIAAVDWLKTQPETRALPVILFSAGAEAATAVMAAAQLPDRVLTAVSWDGQPELVGEEVPDRIRVPVLFVVGDRDPDAVRTNREAAQRAGASHAVREVPGASHRFEEPGALDRAAELTREWVDDRLRSL